MIVCQAGSPHAADTLTLQHTCQAGFRHAADTLTLQHTCQASSLHNNHAADTLNPTTYMSG